MDSSALAFPSPFHPTEDPLWLMIEEGFTPAREREFESLFAVCNGYLGNRLPLPFGMSPSAPTTLLAGVFDVIPPSSLPEITVVPGLMTLSVATGAASTQLEHLSILEHRRMLDLQQGLFRRAFRYQDENGKITRIRFLRVASLADRHALFYSALITPENYAGRFSARVGLALPSGPTDAPSLVREVNRDTAFDAVQLFEMQTHSGICVALAAVSRLVADADGLSGPDARQAMEWKEGFLEAEVVAGKSYRVDSLEAIFTSRDDPQPAEAAVAHLEKLLQAGIETAFNLHVNAWQSRWQTADIEIEGDEDAQRAIRFAAYHLIGAANPEDERVSIGARGLTGPAYKGHVFWDTDIFMLPFYMWTHPPSARALVMYRYHTLQAAREKAQKLGYRGALYAWESANTGEETTPTFVIAPEGIVVPILTGQEEHHISADVAYAVWQYWQVTGDEDFLREAGAEILIETARFWASRGKLEVDGLYHIRKIIGPDEYHEGIDDNAYTNWLAQWNLECAAQAVHLLQEKWPQQWQQLAQHLHLQGEEPNAWLDISRRMYTGLDVQSGLIEQFAGYHALEEIDLAQYAERSLPIDVILGRERTQHVKVIKQADVVMVLHLLWERIPAAVREACFRYYEPRTEHGSSLSPSIYALVAARLGDMERAMRYFKQAREIDLADNMGNASGGAHMAALGGLWQAIVFGFAGLSLRQEGLAFTPHCPKEWSALRFSLTCRGQRLRVHMTPVSFSVELAEGTALTVSVAEEATVKLEAGQRSYWERKGDTWKEIPG